MSTPRKKNVGENVVLQLYSGLFNYHKKRSLTADNFFHQSLWLINYSKITLVMLVL